MIVSTSKPWSNTAAGDGGSIWTSMANIVGDPGVGNVLSIQPMAGFTFSTIQWFRNGVAIEGAYDLTYTQTADDVPTPGHPIKITAEISGLTTTTSEFIIST